MTSTDRYVVRIFFMHADFTKKDITEMLSAAEINCKAVWVAKDKDNDVSQGWAWVEFHNENDLKTGSKILADHSIIVTT